MNPEQTNTEAQQNKIVKSSLSHLVILFLVILGIVALSALGTYYYLLPQLQNQKNNSYPLQQSDQSNINKDEMNKNNSINKTINLDDKNNNQTISIHNNDLIIVTLRNPGDGGYKFRTPIYNKDILSNIEYKHIERTSTNLGDFGKETWTFKAIKNGTTKVIFNIFRSWIPNDNTNFFNIQAKVD